MPPSSLTGFEEIPHTADWSLRVWAPTLEELLVTAAEGMYALMGISTEPGESLPRQIVVSGVDAECVLVAFLNELLFLCENEGLAFNRFNLHRKGFEVCADLQGTKITTRQKEIKAATFNGLQVRPTPFGLEALIVFDV